MDTVSTLGLAANCASLVTQIASVRTAVGALEEKCKNMHDMASSILVQLDALEASTAELNSGLSNREISSGRGHKYLVSLEQSLGSCSEVLTYLYDRLNEVLPTSEAGKLHLGRWARVRSAVTEALRDQTQAIQLLASVASLGADDEREAVLDRTTSLDLLRKAAHARSSLLCLEGAYRRASLTALQKDAFSRLGLIFRIAGDVFNPGPCLAAIMAAWRGSRNRRKCGISTSGSATHYSPCAKMSLEGQSASDISWQLGGLKSMVVMLVERDVQAQTADQLSCKKGEALIPAGLPGGEFGDDWVVMKTIGRLGGPGLVPLSCMSVIARSGKRYGSKGDMLRELREAGIPRDEQWKVTGTQEHVNRSSMMLSMRV